MKYLGFVLLVLSGCVMAEETKMDLNNFYLTVGGNYLYVGDHQLSAPVENDSFGFNVGAGLNINEYIAIEANYLNNDNALERGINMSDASPSTTTFDLQQFAISGLLFAPVTERIRLFASVGWHYYELDRTERNLRQNDPAPPADSTIYGDEVFYGAGLSYRVNDSFDVLTTYTRYEYESSPTYLDRASLAIKFNF